MDQTQDIFKLNSKYSIDIDDVLRYGNEKKKVARRRWAILARALKSPNESQPSSPTDEFSVRRISSFMLLKTQQLLMSPIELLSLSSSSTTSAPLSFEDPDLDLIKKRTWYKYSFTINEREYSINVGHRNRTFSAEDLMGFNNTGNVCIWPSEETLSYYVCSNLDRFKDRSVLELGGGMSCLAGLFAAKYGGVKEALVTDGNRLSVENVCATIKCNQFDDDVSVKCKVLKWSQEGDSVAKAPTHHKHYDVILCADCLFFDDARADLIDCLDNYLTTNGGIAYVMAPRRGDTLDRFIRQSQQKGFHCSMVLNYNDVVWQRRMKLLENNCEYDDNIHYPILIEVTKVSK